MMLKEKESRELEKKYGKKKARDMAEMKFQERIGRLDWINVIDIDLTKLSISDNFERGEHEREREERERARLAKERMRNAQVRADQPIDDSAVVDDMFGFLEDQKDTVSESQAPSAFRDLPAPKVIQNGDIIPGIPTTPEDHEDLSEYKFQKFATTYFQGTVNHQYSKKPLKHPLLPLQTQGDQLASLALWITILR